MIRKNVILSLFFAVAVAVLGQAGKSRFTDQGLCDVHTLDDLKKYSFSFVSVDGEEDASAYKEYEKEYIQDCGECSCIFTVSPTGGYKMGRLRGMQEVEVTGVIRGDGNLAGTRVWIDGMPGLNDEEGNGKLYIDNLFNYMLPGNEYLLFCNAYGPIMLEERPDCSKYYSISGLFDYFNISRQEPAGGIVETGTEYTFDELSGYEYFGTCQSALDEKQRIKEALVKKFVGGRISAG